MVHLYVSNPVHKLRTLTKIFSRGSRRLLRSTNNRNARATLAAMPTRSRVDLYTGIGSNRHRSQRPGEQAVRDADYYTGDSDSYGGFCIFQVENTLFKVQRCFLTREPSAFGDMFSLSNYSNNHEGQSDESPIPLSDTVEQFRDLLWALYALPTELLCLQVLTGSTSSLSMERLINVAEMTNKYCFASYESWATEALCKRAQDPNSFLRHESYDLCARVLNVAVLCDHQKLLDIVAQKLISRVLWTDSRPDPLTVIAERHGLRKLLGVCYYKQLVNTEQVFYDGVLRTQPVFPSSTPIEKRMRFLAAHHSLLMLWERTRATPPSFQSVGCFGESDCSATWEQLWLDAGIANETIQFGSADILGRLKFMMIYLKKVMAETQSMSVQCTMGALEAISALRDEIIEGLLDHFMVLDTEYIL